MVSKRINHCTITLAEIAFQQPFCPLDKPSTWKVKVPLLQETILFKFLLCFGIWALEFSGFTPAPPQTPEYPASATCCKWSLPAKAAVPGLSARWFSG